MLWEAKQPSGCDPWVIPVNANLALLRSEAKLEVFLSQHMHTYEQKEMLMNCSDWTLECVLIQVF